MKYKRFSTFSKTPLGMAYFEQPGADYTVRGQQGTRLNDPIAQLRLEMPNASDAQIGAELQRRKVAGMFPSTPMTAPSIPKPLKGAPPVSKRSRFLNKRNLAIGGGALGLGALGAGAYALSRRGNQEEAKYSRGVGRRAEFINPGIAVGLGVDALGHAATGGLVGVGVAGLRNRGKAASWSEEERRIMAMGTPEEKAAMAAKLNSEGRRVSYRKAAGIGAGVNAGTGIAGNAMLLNQMRRG